MVGDQGLESEDGQWEVVREDTYDNILFYSFVLLVPVATVLTVLSKLRHVLQLLHIEDKSEHGNAERRHHAFRLQAMGLADDEDRDTLRRYIQGWHVRKSFALFLSHYKNEASAEARVLKTELVRIMRTPDDTVFLDSDQLHDLRDLLQNVADSDALVLMNTSSVLSRPWCLMELHAAATNGVPIILCHVDNANAGKATELFETLKDLPGYLASTNPSAAGVLAKYGGADGADAATQAQIVASMAEVIAEALSDVAVVSFSSHQSRSVIDAQVAQIAAAVVEKARPIPEALSFLSCQRAHLVTQAHPGSLYHHRRST